MAQSKIVEYHSQYVEQFMLVIDFTVIILLCLRILLHHLNNSNQKFMFILGNTTKALLS